MRIFLVIIMAALLSGCAGSGLPLPVPPDRIEKIRAYLRTADHLSEEQKQDMTRCRPFVGMRMEEADLILSRTNSGMRYDGKRIQADYRDHRGLRYSLFFDGGTPNRIVKGLILSDEEFREFRKPRDVRPKHLFPFPRW